MGEGAMSPSRKPMRWWRAGRSPILQSTGTSTSSIPPGAPLGRGDVGGAATAAADGASVYVDTQGEKRVVEVRPKAAFRAVWDLSSAWHGDHSGLPLSGAALTSLIPPPTKGGVVEHDYP